MKIANNKNFMMIYSVFIFISFIVIYIFLMGTFKGSIAPYIMLYIGIISFIIGLICIIIPSLTKSSEKDSRIKKYSFFFYVPSLFFILSGFVSLSFSWPKLQLILLLIISVTLTIGSVYLYKHYKKKALVESGKTNTKKYLEWYDDARNKPVNRS